MNDIDLLLEREFPVENKLIYLNHAAVAPWPMRTAQAVAHFAEQNCEHGAQDYPRWRQIEQRLRAQLAQLINAPSEDDIALLKNTSEGLSMIAHGFPWESGDNLVIAREEFPSNRIVWESLADRGVSVREVVLTGCADPEAALMAATDDRTRLLSVSTVQYATGLRLDLAALGDRCRARGIAFCVDAIQGLGVVPHDVQAMAIDFLVADGHKWLLAPEGIAVFYCAADWRRRLRLHEYGWHMTERYLDFGERTWQPAASARRFECGSPNMLGIHALSASLSLILEIGVAEMERRLLARAAHIFQQLDRRADVELITSATPGRYAGIVTFRHRTVAATELHRHLSAQGVVCAQRGDGVRFSPHAYTRLRTLDRALALIPA
jgi:selenocysteine lyase/cysteine desulfurase